jgi:hypothetical protein
MGKFTDVREDIFSVFNDSAWKAENIATYPVNFVVTKSTEFIRVDVIPSGRGINRVSVSGMLLIDIFIPAGFGPSRATFIADKLDLYLDSKSVKTNAGVTQFGQSTLASLGKDRGTLNSGQDKDNPALYRMEYSIPFNYFLGV